MQLFEELKLYFYSMFLSDANAEAYTKFKHKSTFCMPSNTFCRYTCTMYVWSHMLTSWMFIAIPFLAVKDQSYGSPLFSSMFLQSTIVKINQYILAEGIVTQYLLPFMPLHLRKG